jgi:anhydro-N-acetylmuramic acid kinase
MYCIGLISGTSVDGIDVALVHITGIETDLQIELLTGATYPYTPELRKKILSVCGGELLSVEELATLDDQIATEFATAALRIQKSQPQAELIGSHGQTVFHRPPQPQPATGITQLGYSLQLGRGEVIAQITQIPTVSNFRAADLAAGGQGAPLVPKVDVYLFAHSHKTRCIQNLGGIGNVTYLPATSQENWQDDICGFDTGPGNVLLDLAVTKLSQGKKTYDHNGDWASRGNPCPELVDKWLLHPFFQEKPPKSTGRELFSPIYLEQCWQDAQTRQLSDADFLATLVELTVVSLVDHYRTFLPQMPEEVILCGGGRRNLYLQKRLQNHLQNQSQVVTTDTLGIDGDYKEALAFAVLAYWRFVHQLPGNLPQVTGAKKSMLLGDIHAP